MQENFRLLKSVLEKLHKAHCLEHIILIGSWASHLYQFYYDSEEYRPLIRTSDVDFLIPNPRKVNAQDINIGAILEDDLKFIKSFNRSNGLIKYEREGLTIEFLVPEMGRGGHRPIKIKELNVTAQPLRFLNMLTENPLLVKYEGMKIKVPDPIAYAFHKLIISGRRQKEEKQSKDFKTAAELLQFLQSKGMQSNILAYFDSLRPGWKKEIKSVLKNGGYSHLLESNMEKQENET